MTRQGVAAGGGGNTGSRARRLLEQAEAAAK